MAQNTIDSLDIVISADTRKASQAVNSLIKKLGSLRGVFKSLNTTQGGIKPLVKGLQDIAKIDFSGVERSLENLATLVKELDAKKIDQIQKGLQALEEAQSKASPSASKEAKALLDQYKGVYKGLETSFLKMDETNYEETITKAQDFVNQTEEAVRKYGEAFVDIHNKALRQLQKVNAKVEKENLRGEESGGKNAIGSFIKRIGARLAFSIVRIIIQAIKDLVKQLISDFAQLDANFNGVISEAWSAIKYLKNAIKASFAPVVQLLSPIITMLARAFGDMLNKVAELTAMISGQDYYYKAKMSVEDFAESAKTAGKSLSTSFDVLNVLNGADDNLNNFEKVEIESNNSLKRIVELLTTLEYPIELIAESLHIVPLKLLFQVLEVLEPAIVLLTSVLSTLNNTITAVIQTIFLALAGDFESIPKVWADFAEEVVSTWSSFVQDISNSWWAKTILDYVEKIERAVNSPREAFATGFADVGGTSTGDKVWKNIVGVLTGGFSYLFTGTGFATGGFPEDGLFMANHNELVGKFSNGKTAVANNEQITQGIYQAVLQAMRESGGKQDIVVQLDGREIARAVNKQNANMGSRMFMGGAINYGK